MASPDRGQGEGYALWLATHIEALKECEERIRTLRQDLEHELGFYNGLKAVASIKTVSFKSIKKEPKTVNIDFQGAEATG